MDANYESLSFETEGQSYELNVPLGDSGSFITSDSLVVKLNSDQIIEDKFNEKYRVGKEPIVGIKLITQIISGNKAARLWYDQVKEETSQVAGVPTVFRDKIDPSVYAKLSKGFALINDKKKAQAEEVENLAVKQRAETKAMQNRHAKELADEIGSSNVGKILLIERERLPLSLICIMSGYGAKLSENAEDKVKRRAHARECITRYQVLLLDICKDNPDMDIDNVIDAFVEK